MSADGVVDRLTDVPGDGNRRDKDEGREGGQYEVAKWAGAVHLILLRKYVIPEQIIRSDVPRLNGHWDRWWVPNGPSLNGPRRSRGTSDGPQSAGPGRAPHPPQCFGIRQRITMHEEEIRGPTLPDDTRF